MLLARPIIPDPELRTPILYRLATRAVVVVSASSTRRRVSARQRTAFRWRAAVPIAGLAALAGSTISLYDRQLYWLRVCFQPGLEIACRSADASLYLWGIICAALALAFGASYAAGLWRMAPRLLNREWGARLLAGEVVCFAVVIFALSLTTPRTSSISHVTAISRGFVTVGFAALFLVECGPIRFDDTWGIAGRVAALVHGTISMTVALVYLGVALGPSSWVL